MRLVLVLLCTIKDSYCIRCLVCEDQMLGVVNDCFTARNVEMVECEDTMDWCESSFSPTKNLIQRGCFSRNYTESEWGCGGLEFSCRYACQGDGCNSFDTNGKLQLTNVETISAPESPRPSNETDSLAMTAQLAPVFLFLLLIQ